MIRILEQFRKIAFWVLDWIKGGKIWRHYREIKLVQTRPDSAIAKEIKKENLTRILQHAVTTVPFYFDLSPQKIQLEQFPVVNKQKIREHFEEFRSLPYRDKHSHQVLTSGSTGKPFKILHDKNKRNRNTADTIYFAKQAGYNLGARLYYLRLWDRQYTKNRIQSFMQNMVTHSVDDLGEKNIAKLVQQLENDRSCINILAYTSALGSICKYLESNFNRPLKGKYCSIIAVAEALGNDVRQKVQKYFGAEVVSRYSNSENGILAQQRPKVATAWFEINWASYHVEILDLNKDIPVKHGEPGRIVITDLFNYSMPLVRYDTGDVGIMEQDPVNGNLAFTKIEGRKMDMFINTRGEFISSHIIHHILQFRGIEQFQFVQEQGHEYVIKMKVTSRLDDQDEDALRRQYLDYFGHDANIILQYVDDIPLLPSGKRKLVVNNVIQKKASPKRKENESREKWVRANDEITSKPV